MRVILNELHQHLEALTGHAPASQDWAPTPQRQLGDVAFPCFKLSKLLKKPPNILSQELATQVAARLGPHSLIQKIVPTGPYLNVFIAMAPAWEVLKKSILEDSTCTWGSSALGRGKTLVLDFSSPNMAKEIGLHHLRSTAIGNALAQIAELHGYRTVRINYLGDWGTSHGKNIMALKTLGSEETLRERGLSYILDLYVQYNDLIKKEEGSGKTPSPAAEAAREAFLKLEKGDPECRRVWSLLREISIEEAKNLYARLGIRFDHFDGEAMYENRLQGAVNEVTQKIGTRSSDGALVCDLPGHNIPILLQKDDGASLYITRDLVAAQDRYERFQYDLSFYVVAVQQKLHFRQLFDLLKALQKPFAEKCEHISFGMLSFGAKTMKSREGNILFLKDVLDEAKRRALQIIHEKNPDLPAAEETAEMIGQGALFFADLSQNRNRDISFDWETALSFEGDTAPFIQYTHARCCSLTVKGQQHLDQLRKSSKESKSEGEEKVRQLLEEEPPVRQLIGDMIYFQTFSERAWNDRDPSQIATATLSVARSFNQLYHHIRFLGEVSPARLTLLLELTLATQKLLAHGLSLLGIRAPREM